MTENVNNCPIGEMLNRQLVEAEIHDENSFQSVSTPSPVSELSNSSEKENLEPNKRNENATELWQTQKFEDTLNQNDREVFLRILHSLIAQGEDSEQGITNQIISEVLTGRPPTWLHVISTRLKGLILTPEQYKARHQLKLKAVVHGIASKNIRLTDKPPKPVKSKIKIKRGVRQPQRKRCIQTAAARKAESE